MVTVTPVDTWLEGEAVTCSIRLGWLKKVYIDRVIIDIIAGGLLKKYTYPDKQHQATVLGYKGRQKATNANHLNICLRYPNAIKQAHVRILIQNTFIVSGVFYNPQRVNISPFKISLHILPECDQFC